MWEKVVVENREFGENSSSSSLGLRGRESSSFSVGGHSAAGTEMGSSSMNKFGKRGFRLLLSRSIATGDLMCAVSDGDCHEIKEERHEEQEHG